MAMFECNVNSNLGTEPTLLWENPNPSAVFAAQTISLDLSEYEGVIVEYKILYSVNQYGRTYVKKNESFISLGGVVTSGSNYEPKGRKVSANNDGVIFDGGVSAANTTNNGAIIPTKIYGVKNNAQIGNSNLGGKLLWTNPNPNSNFNGQNLTLDLSQYKSIIFKYKQNVTNPDEFYGFGFANKQILFSGSNASAPYNRSRRFITINSNTNTINIGDASNVNGVDNSTAIPLEIYGVRFKVIP